MGIGISIRWRRKAYRMQVLCWTDGLESLYETAQTLKALRDDDIPGLIARCKDQGYFESLKVTNDEYNDCDFIEKKRLYRPD